MCYNAPTPPLYLQHYSSPCGPLLLAATAHALCLCTWEEGPHLPLHLKRLTHTLHAEISTLPSPILQEAKTQLDNYFSDPTFTFHLPLRLIGTDFQQSVWQSLCSIPCGATCSYMDIANSIHRPKSVRAVAGAIGSNPISIIIPCHRVIGTNHSLTGYEGGLQAKEYLLRHERAL